MNQFFENFEIDLYFDLFLKIAVHWNNINCYLLELLVHNFIN